MVLYKVVQKNTRFGSNWAIFSEKYIRREETLKEYKKFRKDHPDLFPRYLKGIILTANPITIGFMMFKEIYNAELFQELIDLKETTKIIEIEPLGQTKTYNGTDKCILQNCGGNPKNLLNLYKNTDPKEYPFILCYPQLPIVTCHMIKVLT